MSKSYKPKDIDVFFDGAKIDFAEGSYISISPKEENTSLTFSDIERTISFTLNDECAKKVREALANTTFAPSYDNERICPLCEGQNDLKVVDSIDGCPCEIKTYCTDCGHEDYWAYGTYEPKCENGEFI